MNGIRKNIYLLVGVFLLSSVIVPDSWAKSISSNRCEVVTKDEMVDKSHMEADTGWKGWDYGETHSNVDLNADGKAESIVIKARVAKEADTKEFLWDDGQPWVVLIKETTGDETIVFLGWVQLSEVQSQILPSKRGKKKILRLTIPQADDYADDGKVYKVSVIYDITYSGPNQFSACQTTVRQVKK